MIDVNSKLDYIKSNAITEDGFWVVQYVYTGGEILSVTYYAGEVVLEIWQTSHNLVRPPFPE